MQSRRSRVVAAGLAVVALATCAAAVGAAPPAAEPEEAPVSAPAATLRLSSPAFADGTPIPVRYTADGLDLSPPLTIAGVPAGVKSLALIVDDPDAPRATWVHWVAWNLPPALAAVAEGELPKGAVSGRNSWGRSGYGGPAPPSGVHRYFFKLYALDTVLDLPGSADAAALERAMRGHVLARAELMGTYTRQR